MPNYQNSKIYKLWCPQGTEEEVYFGSTTLDLSKRKTQHKTSSRKCSSSILFEKYDDVRIELVEKCPCNDKQELIKYEGYYIRNFPCLNKKIPDRTRQEYNKEYSDNNKERRKEYCKNNKDKIAEKWKEYYEKNKEQIAERKKEYVKKNKEQIAERKKAYNKIKVTCECGCIIRKGDLARHKKSNKHLELMKD